MIYKIISGHGKFLETIALSINKSAVIVVILKFIHIVSDAEWHKTKLI
jgi:hypothetical protein